MRRGAFFRASIGLTAAALAASIISTLGAQWLAEVVVAKRGFRSAIHQAGYDFAAYPLATLLLLSPWLAMAWLVFRNRDEQRDLRCLVPYGLALLLNLYLYVDAQLATARYVQQHKWTAASLTTGFASFYAIGVLTIAALASRFLAKR